MSTVLLEKHDGYAIVTLNRPQAMNALSRELRRDFVAAFRAFCADATSGCLFSPAAARRSAPVST